MPIFILFLYRRRGVLETYKAAMEPDYSIVSRLDLGGSSWKRLEGYRWAVGMVLIILGVWGLIIFKLSKQTWILWNYQNTLMAHPYLTHLNSSNLLAWAYSTANWTGSWTHTFFFFLKSLPLRSWSLSYVSSHPCHSIEWLFFTIQILISMAHPFGDPTVPCGSMHNKFFCGDDLGLWFMLILWLPNLLSYKSRPPFI